MRIFIIFRINFIPFCSLFGLETLCRFFWRLNGRTRLSTHCSLYIEKRKVTQLLSNSLIHRENYCIVYFLFCLKIRSPNLWMKVLVAKLGKSNIKCSVVSLGLRRLHYNYCLINRFFIDVLGSNISKVHM